MMITLFSLVFGVASAVHTAVQFSPSINRVTLFHPFTLGYDFDVLSPINLTALAIVVMEPATGLKAPTPVAIHKRAGVGAGTMVVQHVFPVGANRSSSDTILAFAPVSARLDVGLYSIFANYTAGLEMVASSGYGDPFVVDTADGSISIGAGLNVADGVLYTYPTILHAGGSFNFTVLRSKPAPISADERSLGQFSSCEDAVCYHKRPGQFLIRGESRFCRLDGFMLLWQLNESSCEAQGLNSSRAGGCETFFERTCQGPVARTAVEFREVIGADFGIEAVGGTGAFAADKLLGVDGVVVSTEDEHVWTFVAPSSNPPGKDTLCPCSEGSTGPPARFGPSWSCDSSSTNRSLSTWAPLFGSGATVCRGTNDTDTPVNGFRRVLAAPRSYLRVSICTDGPKQNENLKLTSGSIWVRQGLSAPNCAVATLPPGGTSTSTGTAAATVTTATTATTATTTAATATTATAAADQEDEDPAFKWIVPTVIACVLLVVVVVLTVLLVQRRSSSAQSVASPRVELTTARAPSDSDRYGSVEDVRSESSIGSYAVPNT